MGGEDLLQERIEQLQQEIDALAYLPWSDFKDDLLKQKKKELAFWQCIQEKFDLLQTISKQCCLVAGSEENT